MCKVHDFFRIFSFPGNTNFFYKIHLLSIQFARRWSFYIFQKLGRSFKFEMNSRFILEFINHTKEYIRYRSLGYASVFYTLCHGFHILIVPSEVYEIYEFCEFCFWDFPVFACSIVYTIREDLFIFFFVDSLSSNKSITR